MGLFVTNLHVLSSSKPAIKNALETLLKQPAFVSNAECGWVSVFPEEVQNQDVPRLEHLATVLSRELETDVLALLLHDSDVFCFWFYRNGALATTYNSMPGYFTGVKSPPELSDLAPLARIAKGGVSLGAIEHCLLPPRLPVFGDELVSNFASLIGLDPDLSLTSYDYCQDDETDLDPDEHGIDLVEPIH